MAKPENDTICFVHAVSPIKKSQVNGTEFFDCTLQTADCSKRAVCFTPTKRKILQEFEAAQSPIKIARCNNSSKGNIVIQSYSVISPVRKVDFNYNEKLAQDCVVDLIELENLAPWQLVSVRASVYSVQDPVQYRDISKQELILRDQTACRALYLYGDNVGQLEKNKSYLLKNLRLRIVKNKVFLNTPKADIYEYTEIDPINDLVEASSTEDMTQHCLVGKIIGINEINDHMYCLVCGKKGLVEDNQFSCADCNVKVLKSMVNRKWSIKLVVKDVSTNESFIMFFDNEASHQLADIFQFELDSEVNIASNLFNELLDPVKIYFDIVTKAVSAVKAI